MALFDSLPLIQNSKFNNFFWVSWFLGKNLSNFVSPVWKLHNPYCHNWRIRSTVVCETIYFFHLLYLWWLISIVSWVMKFSLETFKTSKLKFIISILGCQPTHDSSSSPSNFSFLNYCRCKFCQLVIYKNMKRKYFWIIQVETKTQLTILKVSKSRKKILNFSFEPKNEKKYFCISALALKRRSN